jgi:hypothetical protein
VTLSRVVIWSSLINPAMDCVRDERISGETNRSSPHCHAKSKMDTVSDRVAGCAQCVAERNFECRHVRVYFVVIPRSWRIFHLDDFDVGVMTLALTLAWSQCFGGYSESREV